MNLKKEKMSVSVIKCRNNKERSLIYHKKEWKVNLPGAARPP